MPLNPGTILNNRYRTVKLLGQGGFGAVYRAWDLTLERQCALKENLETSPEAQRQFEREAKLLANLSHSNLPRVTDHFVIPGQGQYLVMDYIEGEDLQDKLAGGVGLPESVVLPWIIQICDALIYMHNQPQPVIHRDIKPANIKITPPDALNPQGKAVLVDFGIAKSFDPHTKTTAGARAVTPGYSPLEQYGAATTDARTDIYALAATLYALLTGQAPPVSTDRVVGAPLPPPRTLNDGISPGVETAILKAMEIQPENRFQTAIEFKAALLKAAGAAAQVYAPSTTVATPLATVAVPSERPPSQPPVTPPASRPPSRPPGASPSLQAVQANAGITPRRPIPWKLVIGIAGAGAILICILVAAIVLPGLLKGKPTPTALSAASTRAPTHTSLPLPTQVPTSAPTMAPTPTGAPVNITIWHQWGSSYLGAITAVFTSYMAEHPNVTIVLEQRDNVSDALSVAIPAGQGPDIIGWANDQIGKLALAGNIVDLTSLGVDRIFLAANYEPAAVNGVVWQNAIWGLPESQEGIAIVYNKAVASASDFPFDPTNFDDLLAKAEAYATAHPGRYLLCNQGLGIADAYHEAPIWFGFGMSNYVDDTGKVYLDTPEGIAAGNWIQQFHQYAPNEASSDICRTMITEGTAAAWWTGPWSIADLEAAGIDYGILPMGRPFVGIKTLMITRNAVDRGTAEVALDIIKYFTNQANETTVALANQTIPANTAALNDSQIQALTTVRGFGAALNLGVPLANTPYADVQWGPVGEATMAIWNGSQTVEQALAAAQTTIETDIANMGDLTLPEYYPNWDCTRSEVLCIGLVTDVGVVMDHSFNESAWNGVMRASSELGAVFLYGDTVDVNDYIAKITWYAENNYDVIVTVGFALGPTTTDFAQRYPNVYFIGIDQYQSTVLPNLVGLVFHEDQAGFMVGALAAMMTQTGTVGGVFGTDSVPPVVAFHDGYQNGALYINPNITIISTYHPGGVDTAFTDPDWGAATAASAIQNGADVIFGAGGQTGNGAIIETASHPGLYCIGVDADQWETLPEAHPCLITSAMKLIDPGVYALIHLYWQGSPASGNYYGETGLAPFHDFDSLISQSIRDRLAEISTGLLNGTISTGYNP